MRVQPIRNIACKLTKPPKLGLSSLTWNPIPFPLLHYSRNFLRPVVSKFQPKSSISFCRVSYSTSSNPSSYLKCWSCSAALPSIPYSPLCSSCQKIQPIPSGKNYFEVLLFSPDSQGNRRNSEEKASTVTADNSPNALRYWNIDLGLLKSRFLSFQRVVHPDSFQGKAQKERLLADQVSSYVNKAYKTLQSPLSRAKYLLELYGIPISESDGLDARNDMDQEVLFYVMETREQIEEVNTTRELEELEKLNIEKIQSTLSAINHSIQYLPPPPSTPASSPDWLDSNRKYLNQFKSEVIRLQYLETLNEAIGDKKFRVSIDG